MQLHPDLWRHFAQARWIVIIALSVLLAATGALVIGLGRDQGEVATTYVFGSRVGFDAPLVDLEDHISDIVNSVEFPLVFQRIEDRVLLEAGEDYTLEIGILENTQAVVAVEIRTERTGEADRIARIVAEEMVRFVLEGVDEAVATDLARVEAEIEVSTVEQQRLVRLSGGITPPQAELSIERQLAAIRTESNGPVGAVEGQLLQELSNVSPLADEYVTNQLSLDDLEREAAAIIISRAEIDAATGSISSTWYRSVTPVAKTSNVPVAVAMAFAAAVPALLASTLLVVLNINRRLVVMARAEKRAAKSRLAPA